MWCPVCGGELRRKTFELFIRNGKEEEYGYYRCSMKHVVELLEKVVPTLKSDAEYKTYAIVGEADMPCPACGRMAEHVSDDATSYPDWISHYRRYTCRGTPKHVVRIRLKRIHNNEKTWKEFDLKDVGYDRGDDAPD